MILHDFDFSALDDPDFREDSVREEIITPVLHELGFSATGKNRIVRSKRLQHPFVMLGTKNIKITQIPDYTLIADNKAQCVIDAKSPVESVLAPEHIQQAYSYAIHPDVRAKQFALCNGKEFVLFDTGQEQPQLYFSLEEIEKHWDKFSELLSPVDDQEQLLAKQWEYSNAAAPSTITNIKRQQARRHYGVHPYFTRQAWSVVRKYIESFTRPGDLVLDPFGGTGVTLVEALITQRRGIHIDINPLSVFVTRTLIEPVNYELLSKTYRRIVREFETHAPESEKEIEVAINAYDWPRNVELPADADVRFVEQLFSRKQLAQLSFLKKLILAVDSIPERNTLLLMFSGLLNKINLTCHRSDAGGGQTVRHFDIIDIGWLSLP